MRINKKTLNKLLNNSINVKQNKYRNKKVQYDEMTFDSKKEYSYYLKYKLMEQAGEIKDLKMQVPFTLI